MKVKKLIEKLKEMDEDKEVEFFGADWHIYEIYSVVDYDDSTVILFEDKMAESKLTIGDE